MTLRCQRPECNAEIEGSYVRFDGRRYCSSECCQLYLIQAGVFAAAANPFSQKRKTDAEKERERWSGFAGGRDYGDEDDQLSMNLPRPES